MRYLTASTLLSLLIIEIQCRKYICVLIQIKTFATAVVSMPSFNQLVLPAKDRMNAIRNTLNNYILETTTIVHETIEEETTTTMLVETDNDATGDDVDPALDISSSTISPVHVPLSTECPTCPICTCTTISPVHPILSIQPKSIPSPYLVEKNATSENEIFV